MCAFRKYQRPSHDTTTTTKIKMPKRPNENSQMSRAQWEAAEAAGDQAAASDAVLSDRGGMATVPSPPLSSPPLAVSVSPQTAKPEPSLLQLLQPWLETMSSIFELMYGSDGSDVATVHVSRANRPLMELLILAVLLDATVLHSMVEEMWTPSSISREPTCISKLQFLVGLRDVFHQSAPIEGALREIFPTEPCAADAQDAGLCAVRKELVRRVEAAGKTQQLVQLRVPVALTVSCFHDNANLDDDWSLEEGETDVDFRGRVPRPDQVVQLFEEIAASGQRVIRTQQCSSAAPWVQFTFTKLRLYLDECLPLTTEVARAAQVLKKHAFVTVHRAKLDPRTILCSQDELTSYVKALGHHSTSLNIDTGYSPYDNRMTPIDANGEDKKDVIVKIMTALANCPKIRSIDPTVLLSFLMQPHNRLHYWQSLLEILLAPTPDDSSTRHTAFCLKMDFKLTEEDAVLIKQIPGLTTRRRRRIDQLSMYVSNCEASIVAVLSLVRDMESLDIKPQRSTISAALVAAILKISPELRTLRLTESATSSLDMFVDPTLSASGKCLEQMTLSCPRYIMQSGMTTFLTQLLDPTTPLATTLRTLAIHPRQKRAFELDPTNAELLERVLCVNRRLQDIHLTIDDDVPPTTREALLAHNGDRVWGASQLPETVVSQRCAFLNVVRAFGKLHQVDPVVFRPVFGFGASMLETRKVSVWTDVENPPI